MLEISKKHRKKLDKVGKCQIMLKTSKKAKKVRKRRKCLITTDNVGKIQKCLEKIRKRRKISNNVRNITVRKG